MRPEISNTELGRRIRSLRGEERRDVFCQRIGVSKETHGNYERGDRVPDANYLEILRNRLGVDINWLVTGEVTPAVSAVADTPAGGTASLPLPADLRREIEAIVDERLNAPATSRSPDQALERHELPGLTTMHERVSLLVRLVGGLGRAAEIANVNADTVNNWRKPGTKLPMQGLLPLCLEARVSLDWVACGSTSAPAGEPVSDSAAIETMVRAAVDALRAEMLAAAAEAAISQPAAPSQEAVQAYALKSASAPTPAAQRNGLGVGLRAIGARIAAAFRHGDRP